MKKTIENDCEEGVHQKLRLKKNMSWKCKACGTTWARHETPLIFINEMVVK